MNSVSTWPEFHRSASPSHEQAALKVQTACQAVRDRLVPAAPLCRAHLRRARQDGDGHAAAVRGLQTSQSESSNAGFS